MLALTRFGPTKGAGVGANGRKRPANPTCHPSATVQFRLAADSIRLVTPDLIGYLIGRMASRIGVNSVGSRRRRLADGYGFTHRKDQ